MNIFLGVFLLGVCVGSAISILITEITVKRKLDQISREINSYFTKVLDAMSSGRFVSRLNDNSLFKIRMDGEEYDLYYLMDKDQIAIFKDKDCVKISDDRVDIKIINSIIDVINSRWRSQIDDTVIIRGSIIDRTTYDRLTNNFNEDENKFNISRNESSLDLDDILDRINTIGFDNLTDSEKEFLKSIK